MKNFIKNKIERAKNDLNKYKKWAKKHSLMLLIVLNILAWINLFSIKLGLIPFLFSVLNISKLESQKDQIEVLIKLFTISGAAIGIGLATWRSTIANDNNKLQQKQEINERYAKAVELLGHDSEAVRIGALYTLEHISKEQNTDYFKTCMDVIAGYVRNQSIKFNKEEPAKENAETKEIIYRYLPEDIKTAVNVLSRRSDTEKINLKELNWKNVDLNNTDIEFENLNFSYSNFENVKFKYGQNLSTCILSSINLSKAQLPWVNLTKTYLLEVNLSGANLHDAKLIGTNLQEAKLQSANLRNADLSGAFLYNADLSWADLTDANLVESILSKTNLMRANLQRANLSATKLSEANLLSTNLIQTFLCSADLRLVQSLTIEQLASAIIDEWTMLPDSFVKHKQELIEISEKTYSSFCTE